MAEVDVEYRLSGGLDRVDGWLATNFDTSDFIVFKMLLHSGGERVMA
jgi:hypothetical protein